MAMTRKEAIAAANAARKAGMKIAIVPSFHHRGAVNLMRTYDNAGDSTGFDPYADLGDAVMLATAAHLGVYLTYGEFIVFEDTADEQQNRIKIIFKDKSKKPKNYRIGNAVINLINCSDKPE